MKILLIIIICTLNACGIISEEEEHFTFTMSIQNNTDQTCEVQFFTAGELQEHEFISSNSNYIHCEYLAPAYLGACADSMVFLFPNRKGYSCSSRPSNANTEFCFTEGRNPMGIFGFTNPTPTHYQFEITEENLLNAKEL